MHVPCMNFADANAVWAVAVQAEAEELRGKVEDARAQVQSNEQMIRWLNNQVLHPILPVLILLPHA